MTGNARDEPTPEQIYGARARAWAFVFTCMEKKAAGTNGGKDGKERIKNVPAEDSIPT